MHPVLIKIGSLEVYTYGLCIAIGFLVGILLAKREAVKCGMNPDRIMDLGFYLLIAAIVGSRIFYVFVEPAQFIENPIEIFKVWKGGLVFYGGFIGALITGILYLKKHRMPLWITADIAAPSVAIGHFFGRLGCFFAGCCYGKVCSLPWAVTFTNKLSLAPHNVPLHPTQLYSAFSNLSIFLVLISIRKFKKFNGQLFWIYVILYGIMRSIIEVFRNDFRGGFLFGYFSVSQTIAGIMIVLAFVMLFVLSRQQRSN